MTNGAIREIPIGEIDLYSLIRKTIDEERVAGIMASIREVGLLYPPRLVKRGEKYLPADGCHRIVALMKLGKSSVPAFVEEKPFDEAEAIREGLIANTHRSENSPLEKGEAIDRLMKLTGWNATTVAAKLGLSNATVSRLLSLLGLPEPIREQVHRGDISLTAACELAKVENGDARAAMAADVAGGRLTRDALSGAVKNLKKSADRQDPAGPPQDGDAGPSRVSAKLASGRTVSVSGKGLDLVAFIEALEEVLAKARRARTQGVEVSTFARMLRDQAGVQREAVHVD